jgi:hypothetical protein
LRIVISAFLIALAQTASTGEAQCQGRAPDQVVVCAPRKGESPYRLPKLPQKYDRHRIVASTTLAPGVGATAHVESVRMPDWQKSNRIMLTLGAAF